MGVLRRAFDLRSLSRRPIAVNRSAVGSLVLDPVSD